VSLFSRDLAPNRFLLWRIALAKKKPHDCSCGKAGQREIGTRQATPKACASSVFAVEDSLISRPGARLVQGAELMARLIHPELAAP